MLSDEAMPGMTGSELAREIRRMPPRHSDRADERLCQRRRSRRVRATSASMEVLAKPLVSRDIARSLAAVFRRGTVAGSVAEAAA